MMNNIIEDEENWLYADDTELELKNKKLPKKISQEISLEVTKSTSNEGSTPELESEQEYFEKDSDDDGIIVSVGNTDVKPTFTHETPNIKINSSLLPVKVNKTRSVRQRKKFQVEDFTKPGKIDGTPVVEFNIDDIAEKPWREPDADISDYFNYDFNENTWTAYCQRLKRIKQNESGLAHLQLDTSHCVIPVTNGYPNVPLGAIDEDKKNDIPAINPDRPDSHRSLVFLDMSKPPPTLNPRQFKPEHGLNSRRKPSYTSPGPPIQRSSSSTRLNFSPRSTKSVQEEKRDFCGNNSKERDWNKREERSLEKHTKRYGHREKFRSSSRRSRSRSRSSTGRYFRSNRTGRGY